jgi:dihydroorotase
MRNLINVPNLLKISGNGGLLLKKTLIILLASSSLWAIPSLAMAQQYDLLLKGGQVIDPKNKINAKMDIAITKGKIAKVAANIPASEATKVVDVKGLYVSPGLIDLHTHVFVGTNVGKFADGPSSVKPDDFAPRSGVTTVVDAGTSGWRNFPAFKKQVITPSRTRVLSFLNAFGSGMVGGKAEQDSTDLDVQAVTSLIKDNPDIIVGIKIGHYDSGKWLPFDRALEMGKASNVPIFVECHIKDLSLEDQLNRMRPGDMITHAFEKIDERMPVVDENNKVHPFVIAAQKRGVLFDVGHGGAGFWFSQA